ncbi:DEAD/DEAH box helicase family protein [Sedimenticola selenatireducens]|uniref:DEAD/DEAH box helicase n=1 Tax=Sedimenticola selenatireducens TaxID=191960 RepID=UPI002AABBB57|nr:DEAD/DEAH box helicase family protein [Sedimenticola selenatireducens]
MKLRRWQDMCIAQAYKQYRARQTHFLCLATPGAGKTIMASTLAKRLFDQDMIDLVICFSPSVIVATDFKSELEQQITARIDGLIGSKGCSLTYQSMLSLPDTFWGLLSEHRTFVIFDEIHHCAGQSPEHANAWGEKIISRIQGQATYTLALTGTPWRSDAVPIVLSRYRGPDRRIHCDYQYGLAKAVRDGVCRPPHITIIDNDQIVVRQGQATNNYISFEELLQQSGCSYENLIKNDALMRYMISQADQKLSELRVATPNAGGLIVAGSVDHARQIHTLLRQEFNEEADIATYQEENALEVIRYYKYSAAKWIISVGMISEGTNIPRLQVCCHLTRIKTELCFRQILGRILRATWNSAEKGFLYMPAEPTLVKYARRVAEDIPAHQVVHLDIMNNSPAPTRIRLQTPISQEQELKLTLEISPPSFKSHQKPRFTPRSVSLLADSYESSVDIFGRFRQELMTFKPAEL